MMDMTVLFGQHSLHMICFELNGTKRLIDSGQNRGGSDDKIWSVDGLSIHQQLEPGLGFWVFCWGGWGVLRWGGAVVGLVGGGMGGGGGVWEGRRVGGGGW